MNRSQTEKEAVSNLPPLLARKAAARKHLAGLRQRNNLKGFKVLPNPEDSLDTSFQCDYRSQTNLIEPESSEQRHQTSTDEGPIATRYTVLDKALELLDRVKKAASQSSPNRLLSSEIVQHQISEDTFKELNVPPHNDDLAIDWLLRGIPEIYEETTIVTDDLVEQLLSEGGIPPSQLQYPILYSANQAILSMLSEVKQLHLRLIDLFVFGARCGLRKDGTFLVVRPPPGCSSFETEPSIFEITPPSEYFSMKHKNILKHYHVGQVSLDHTLCWNVHLTDSLIQEWFNYSAVTGSNCIQIEIYSYLTPRTNKGEEQKGRKKTIRRNSALLIGHAYLPLDGLFSSSNLLVNISVSLVLDQASHTLIADRFQRMPIGVKMKPLPLGNSAGYLKCQVSLRNEHSELLNKSISNTTTDPLTAIVSYSDDENKIKMKPIHTALDDALTYLPVESDSAQQISKYLCVAIHYITFSNFEHLLLQSGLINNNCALEIVCVYKVALAHSRYV